MRRATLEKWISDYETVWRSPGTDRLGELFADNASYLTSPWGQPIQGLEDLATFWDTERDGADEEFAMTSEVVAVDGDVGVARVEVRYGNGDRWRDIWIVRFDAAGRCVHFEEWPIAPSRTAGQP
jgi:ketosteroid isomerase-like protein